MHMGTHSGQRYAKMKGKKTFRYKANGGAAMAEFPLKVKENILG